MINKILFYSSIIFFCSCNNSKNNQANTEDKKPVKTDAEIIAGIEMVKVEGGTFLMEKDTSVWGLKPVHSVTLGSYSIGKFEVTQAQWKAIMGNNPSQFQPENLSSFKVEESDQFPVELVTWYYAQDFIQKLNAKTGKNYRMPTEAEWEYAARGGNKSMGYTYSGSNDINAVAWYNNNHGDNVMHQVGTRQPNELGIYDMSGSVLEWCSDIDLSNNGVNWEKRVIRGGEVFSQASSCTPIYKRLVNGDDRSNFIGIRLVLSENP